MTVLYPKDVMYHRYQPGYLYITCTCSWSWFNFLSESFIGALSTLNEVIVTRPLNVNEAEGIVILNSLCDIIDILYYVV
jgi:hypothetical protein